MTEPVYTMDEVAQRLHKSRRWLQEFLRGKSFGRFAGRTRLFTESDIAQLRLTLLHTAMDGLGREARSGVGHVYFIEAGDFIKIGYTQSPLARVIKMMTDSPFELKVLHLEDGTFKQEKNYHRHFAPLRVRGEWFRKAPELLEFIEQRKRIKAGES